MRRGSEPPASAMNIWYLVFRTDSLTYTICRALRECGHEVSVWVVDPEFGSRPDTSIQKRLAETDGVRIVGRDRAQLPATIDRLVVQTFPRPPDTVRDVPLLAARARAVALISAGDRSRRWRDALELQWIEIRSFGVLSRRIDRILYKDGFHPRDLFGLFRRRQAVGFDAHSQFLHHADTFAAIHALDWDALRPRPLLANFLGSQDPALRKVILDSVRDQFQSRSGEAISPRPGKTMFWYEYTDAEPAVLPPSEFIATLTRSDFTLCPRGYSLVTHRPIEALLRGSIPVLAEDELDLYGVELRDEYNCIAVRQGNWPAATERLVRFPEDSITRMRENVLAMQATLHYRRLAAAICRRIGLEAFAARELVRREDSLAAPEPTPRSRPIS
jgi:hypothetical protein